MEITPIQYPAFLPCPTWQFADNRDTFESRTGFESGWTRQRKKFWTNYRTGSLSFYMDTPTYARWTEWVNANGYDWFFIELDQIGGDKFEQVILRFIGPVQFNYDAYDRLRVTVPAEEYSGLPDPAKPVPQDLTGLPECQPYSCSAYDDYLNEAGIAWWKTYTTDPVVDIPYPFAATTSDAGVLFYYSNYLAGAGLVSTWSGGAPGATSGSFAYKSTGVLSDNNPPDYCDGVLRQVICFDSEATSVTGCVARGSPDVLCEWGDHALEAVVCGYNGSNNVAARGAVGTRAFLRGSGKRWRFTRSGTTVTQGDPGTVEIAIGRVTAGDTNNIRVNLAINVGNANTGFVDSFQTLDVLDIADTFFQVSCGISSTGLYEVQFSSGPNAGKYGVARDVTLTCSVAGVSQTLTGTQVYSTSYTVLPAAITDITEMPLTFSTYTQPIALWSSTLSVASLQWGVGQIDGTGLSKISFDRNFADYTPPEYC